MFGFAGSATLGVGQPARGLSAATVATLRSVVVLGSFCLAGASCLTGCGAASEYELSLPEAVPAGAVGRIHDGMIRLQLSTLELAVEIQNHRSTGRSVGFFLPWVIPVRDSPAQSGPSLFVWFGLTPYPHDRDLGFDGRRMMVKAADAAPVGPSAFVGPDTIWKRDKNIVWGCGSEWFSNRAPAPKKLRLPETVVRFQGPRCFVLRFEVADAPERNFTLAVEGIEDAGQTVRVPEIGYRKGRIVPFVALP